MIKLRAFTSVGLLLVTAGACVVACSSSSGNDMAGAGSSNAGSANGGSSSGGASGGKGGQGAKAGAENGDAGTPGSDNGGDTGNGDGTAGAAGNGDGAAGDSGNGATCPGANTQTDAMNCGRCGNVCESGTCTGALCEPMLVLDTPQAPASIGGDLGFTAAVAGGNVYEWQFTTESAADNGIHFYVYSAPAPATALAKTATPTLVQDLPPATNPNLNMTAAAFDGSYVYEAAPGAEAKPNAANAAGSVGRKKLDGSEAKNTLAALFSLPGVDPGDANDKDGSNVGRPPSGISWPTLAIDGNVAYLAGTTNANSGLTWTGIDGTSFYVSSAFPAATQVTKIAGIAAAGDHVLNLTVAGGHLFWEGNIKTDRTVHGLFTAPAAGGTTVKLEDDVGAIDHSGVVSDGTSIYWSITGEAGTLRKAPLSNLTATAATDVADLNNPGAGLVADAHYIYYLSVSADDFDPVYRINKADPTKVDELGEMARVTDLAKSIVGVDAKYVYISDIDGKIWRVSNAP